MTTPIAVLFSVFFVLRLSAGPLEDWSRMKPMIPRGYLCLRASGPVEIDGRLDDVAWQHAAWTKEFVDIRGATMPRPRHATRVKMLWDEQFFYIAARISETHVWGTVTQRDDVIFQDNDFEVFIDPDGDAHDYYEFEMNALNTVWDLRLVKPYKDGAPALNEWNIAGLKTGVHIDGTLNNPRDVDRHWTVEIAMPWKALGEFSTVPSPPSDGDRWRVDFSRVEWTTKIVDGRYQKIPKRSEENWVWSPTGIVDMHRPEKWGLVQFSTATFGERDVSPGPREAARDQLQEIYYRQQAFQETNHRFARGRSEIGITDSWCVECSVRETPTGFEASVPVRTQSQEKVETAHIRQDARFWVTPNEPNR